ncbi:TPA: cupin domain-containing protein [Klebsiella pneumoniae]|nr:cupin domain-containing protein [Klebsiella pneumoniae]STX14730.1 Thermophilic glucose-6-phosphate isomerase and related metalloenzymes [Klebsiella pneumoniae]HCI6085738.1 cupin domain-containing protein [Klebsiella pneumoniae]
MPIRLFHRDKPTLNVPLISKDARFIAWPGTNIWKATMGYVVLEKGEANAPHMHAISDDTIFVLEGAGIARDYTNNVTVPVYAGCAVNVPQGIEHAIIADDQGRMVNIGGPSPADLGLLKHICAIDADAEIPED